MTATTVAAPALNFALFYVADLDASYDYFAQTLGLTPNPSGDVPNYRQFAASPQGIAFGLVQAGEHTPAPGEVDLYLGTPDIAALRDAWIARGVDATPLTTMPFGTIFEVATPDGRKLTAIG